MDFLEFITIASFGASIASLLCISKKNINKAILLVFFITFIVSGLFYYFEHSKKEQYFLYVKDNILLLIQDNTIMSFEQIYEQLNYVEYQIASKAVDELVYEKKISYSKTKAMDINGKELLIGIYSLKRDYN